MKTLFNLGIFALIIYALFFRGGAGKESMSRVVISQPTPVQNVAGNQRVRVVLFTGTEWCPACTHLDSNVIATKEWLDFQRAEIAFQKVDVPADRSRLKEGDQLLISKYGVSGYPTMVVLDARGKELSRQVGAGPPVENYKDWIRRHRRFY
jgi:thiol:disulfide interchange protein